MIGFYFRESNGRSKIAAEKLKNMLLEANYNVCEFYDDNTNFDTNINLELLIVFGGDGSVLRASKIGDKIPIVAINTGNLGFLTSYEEKDLYKLVEDIQNNNLKFSSRRFMSVSVGNRRYFALNDVVIMKDYASNNACECVKLDFAINGQFVDEYVADGLIVATPTGSTAYAISAGGPIIEPNLDAFVAAPICAHSLHSRPIVYSSSSIAKVTVCKESSGCALYIDGKFEGVIDDVVTISYSDKFAKICDNSGKFFLRLSEKLSKWSIGNKG